MANLRMKIQHLEFPECTKEALKYIGRTLTEPHRGIPGLGGSNENIANELAQEFIVDIARRGGYNTKRLTAVHELQMLEMVCSTIQEALERTSYPIFMAIFGGHVDPAKISLMTKLVSMAISVSSSVTLSCAALWMQEQGSQSQPVCDLAQRLVDDYCLLYPNVSAAFKRLPQVSSLFACNFMTVLTTIYTYTDVDKSPPFGLLECIVEWISDNPSLCMDSVRMVRMRSNFTCPVSGLVRWCVLGPLITACGPSSPTTSSTSSSATSSTAASSSHVSASNSEQSNTKLMTLFSKLHLGILLSLQSYKSMDLNQTLFSYTDLYIVSRTLASQYRDGRCSEAMLQVISMSVDKLAQTIQLALAAGSLPDKFNISQVCEGLPLNRLLQIIVNKRYGRQEIMERS